MLSLRAEGFTSIVGENKSNTIKKLVNYKGIKYWYKAFYPIILVLR